MWMYYHDFIFLSMSDLVTWIMLVVIHYESIIIILVIYNLKQSESVLINILNIFIFIFIFLVSCSWFYFMIYFARTHRA